MKKGFFIVGTDTGVGKTTVSLLLLKLFKKLGYTTAALKPIAAGAIKTKHGLRNEDALLLQEVITTNWDYEKINPFIFEPPISPNFAAAKANSKLTVAKVVNACQPVLNSDADIIVVESAGGWLVPINQQQTMADLATAFNLPLILVVGLRLGCLNHTLLTYQAIKASGLKLAGWMANKIDPEMLCVDDNIKYLKDNIDAPLLSVIPNFGNI